ncbi:MAG: DNA-directed RNA polymerase subunit omega, partial [Lachnospiraceae bacterium]|nr:DNA-directed RNA polymerase subunit omega [Lachnospiraceae bacterium]
VNSRYSIVRATAKRARQLVDGAEPMIETTEYDRPLSTAVEELYEGKLKIESHDQDESFV